MSNRRRGRRPPGHVARPGWEVSQLFFGVGAVKLTEEVITELVARGWPRADLECFARRGAMYSRLRDSIVFPPGVYF
jgi:hypothetical protein